jgi:Predicted membrane protein (DUF2231)
MPQNLFGLPTHILLLHVVVVLLPVAAAATVLVALVKPFRHRYGLAVVAFTFVTTLFVPLTSQSGEGLAARLPDDPSIARHAAIGQQLVIWAAAFGLCLAAVVALDLLRRASAPAQDLTTAERWAAPRVPGASRNEPARWTGTALAIARVLAVVAAIGVTVMVIRAGHSGAQAVWNHYPDLKAAP